jgi:oxalate decarboxylase/phosphoglucose isomerase-like protein (cupin superfamily)
VTLIGTLVISSLQNTGSEPLAMIVIFSRPGFEDYLRAVSVPEGQKAEPLSLEELTAIRVRHRQHVVFQLR